MIFSIAVTSTLTSSLMALLLILFEHLTALCILPQTVKLYLCSRQCINRQIKDEKFVTRYLSGARGHSKDINYSESLVNIVKSTLDQH